MHICTSLPNEKLVTLAALSLAAPAEAARSPGQSSVVTSEARAGAVELSCAVSHRYVTSIPEGRV